MRYPEAVLLQHVGSVIEKPRVSKERDRNEFALHGVVRHDAGKNSLNLDIEGI